jgi:hypothetical protein
MARLFIFAIGGTGSRVLKSLTMLLAAGLKPNSQRGYEIVPIIIDPHKSNEDLKRTERLLVNYQSITNAVGLSNGFFATKITTLDNLVKSQDRIGKSFTFNLQQVSNTKFKDYIDFNQLPEPSKCLADILFSGKSISKSGEAIDLLDIEMDIGFVGNPNVGSVVLNQFKDSNEFKEFASNYGPDDRVFIISSIFGGTGAAGFPVILKNIRNAMNNTNIDSKGFLQNAKIGAISVLPYFNVEKDKDSPIQKSDFIGKTKAALYYYKDNVTGNNSVNALYYIADDHSGTPYKNDPGEHGQQNDAHFVELVSALAILDYLEIPDEHLITNAGEAERPIYKEFGIKDDDAVITYTHLEDFTEKRLALKLSQLAMFDKYLNERLHTALELQAWSTDQPVIGKTFINDPLFRTNLQGFLGAFREWLEEMSRNRRGFAPFVLDTGLDSMIRGKTVESGLFSRNMDYYLFDNELSRKSKGKSYSSPAQKLINLFAETTEQILTSKFGLIK